jgi:hypothetical protein
MLDQFPVDAETAWWCLKAGRGGVLEDDWLDRRFVSVGWGDEGPDYREHDPASFRERDPSHRNQLSKFMGCHDEGMQTGDVVIAYAPEKGNVSGVGRVGEPKYDPDRTFRHLTEEQAAQAQVDDHYYWRPVSWFDWGTPVAVSHLSRRFQVNGRDQIPTPATLYRFGTLASDDDRIETLVEEIHAAETVDSSPDEFGPDRETEIQEWVVANARELGLVNPRREVKTDVGRIDVLAEDDNSEVVVELKRGRAGDRAIGQLLGYMGARRNDSSTPVRGLLIAESFTPRAREAASIIETVSLFEFDVTTSVNPI